MPPAASRQQSSRNVSSPARPTSGWRSTAAASGAGQLTASRKGVGAGTGVRLAHQQPMVRGQRGRPGRRAELVAQQHAQALERAQGLGGIARRLVDLHQRPVRGLAERRGGDRGPRRLLGGAELAAAATRAGQRERLQRAQAQRLALAPAFAGP